MKNTQIYEMVERYVTDNLKGVSFDKGLPYLQEFVWSLGDKVGKTGVEILRIYFDEKSRK